MSGVKLCEAFLILFLSLNHVTVTEMNGLGRTTSPARFVKTRNSCGWSRGQNSVDSLSLSCGKPIVVTVFESYCGNIISHNTLQSSNRNSVLLRNHCFTAEFLVLILLFSFLGNMSIVCFIFRLTRPDRAWIDVLRMPRAGDDLFDAIQLLINSVHLSFVS